MNRITPFTLQQNIATDNAFSTIQVIHQIKAKMDEVITIVNGIETDAHEYTDAKVLELSNRIDGEIDLLENIVRDNNQRVSEINARVVILESDLAELNNLLFTKYAELDSKITDEKNARIQADLNTLAEAINYMDSEINKLKDWIEEVINDRTAYVYSQWDGSKKRVDEAFADLMEATAREKSRELTYEWLSRLFDVPFVTGATTSALFGDYPISEFLDMVDGLNPTTNYFFRQVTSTGGSQVIANVIPTVDDYRINTSMSWLYYLYKMAKNRDEDSYVSWYTFHATLGTSLGWDLVAWVNTFVYTIY